MAGFSSAFPLKIVLKHDRKSISIFFFLVFLLTASAQLFKADVMMTGRVKSLIKITFKICVMEIDRCRKMQN